MGRGPMLRSPSILMNERIYDIQALEAAGRSSAATLVCKIANLIPIGVTQFRNQSLPIERYFAQPKWARAFPLGDDLAQALFDQRTKGRAVAGCDFSRLAQERIGYIERRLHVPYSCLCQYG